MSDASGSGFGKYVPGFEFLQNLASQGKTGADPESEIVALIETLVARGFAYAPGNGDVYYAVRKFPEYGRLSKRNLDDLLSGARVEPGEAKRDPLDFALWKGAKPGEPSWDSPWGTCSRKSSTASDGKRSPGNEKGRRGDALPALPLPGLFRGPRAPGWR